jgi:hypothetical protein
LKTKEKSGAAIVIKKLMLSIEPRIIVMRSSDRMPKPATVRVLLPNLLERDMH